MRTIAGESVSLSFTSFISCRNHKGPYRPFVGRFRAASLHCNTRTTGAHLIVEVVQQANGQQAAVELEGADLGDGLRCTRGQLWALEYQCEGHADAHRNERGVRVDSRAVEVLDRSHRLLGVHLYFAQRRAVPSTQPKISHAREWK